MGYATSTIRLSSSNSTYGSTAYSPYGGIVNVDVNDVDIFKTIPVTIPVDTYDCKVYISVTQREFDKIASAYDVVFYSVTSNYNEPASSCIIIDITIYFY